MENSEFHYESLLSKTKFQALDLDPEHVGMQDFRKAERTAVLDFLESPDQILVMGGIGSAGKTFTFHHLAKDHSLDYVFASTPRDGENIVQQLMDGRVLKNPQARALIIDEGVRLTRNLEGG